MLDVVGVVSVAKYAFRRLAEAGRCWPSITSGSPASIQAVRGHPGTDRGEAVHNGRGVIERDVIHSNHGEFADDLIQEISLALRDVPDAIRDAALEVRINGADGSIDGADQFQSSLLSLQVVTKDRLLEARMEHPQAKECVVRMQRISN